MASGGVFLFLGIQTARVEWEVKEMTKEIIIKHRSIIKSAMKGKQTKKTKKQKQIKNFNLANLQ